MLIIDYKSGVPIFEQIYQSIIKLGAAGAFGDSGQLPSVRSVAKDLGINPNTVQKAYGMLEHDGVIYSMPGKGSFLADADAVLKKRRSEAVARVGAAVKEALDCGVSREELIMVISGEEAKKEVSL